MDTTEAAGHVSVLLQEAIDGLNLKRGSVFVDATLGSAGHAKEVFKRFGDSVRIVGIDVDPSRIKHAREVLSGVGAILVEENFRNIDHVLQGQGIQTVSAILFDLGLNSEQLEDSRKGFSFKRDEPLLMTFGEASEGVQTAAYIVNTFDEVELARIIYEYGEERYSRRIARAIVQARKIKPIVTTCELVSVIEGSVLGAYRHGRIHPATRTFQALRIAVNDELSALSEGLSKALQLLSAHGRIAVISFHSLEDRIVKNFFRDTAKAGEGTVITKKPIYPREFEVRENPRSRSAKLRIFEKN